MVGGAARPWSRGHSLADIPIGVVTISDRAFRGVYEDKGGPGIEAALAELLASRGGRSGGSCPTSGRRSRRRWSRSPTRALPLILTTGGTGPAPRDVTPEATEAVCDRVLPGFGERMRRKPRRSADRDPVAPDRGNARREPHHQPAGQAGRDPHLPRRGVRRCALLRRPHRRPAARDQPALLRGVPAEGLRLERGRSAGKSWRNRAHIR